MPNPTEYAIPYFGKLNLTHLDDHYKVNIDFNGRSIKLDMNFDKKVAKEERLDAVKALIESLHQVDAKNKEYILHDFEDAETDSVKFYFRFHLEEMGEEELAALVGSEDKSLSLERQLLNKLNLVRVGFYPDKGRFFAICDYSFGKDITNYVLVIFLNESGDPVDITVES